MQKIRQLDEEISDGVNLLISILVRFPEIGTIRFDQHNNSLKTTFMLSSIPSGSEFKEIRRLLLDSLAAYHMLEGLAATLTEIELSTYERMAMLTILRDVHTLSKGEFALIITLLRDCFKDRLVSESNDVMLEEDLLMQEEQIDNMLENMKQQHIAQSLIGFREDGRVVVFNK
ncbi:MAG: hypothetical protein LLG02_05905 [Pelosinus sp.]|nr:hypothetical protein [Pelosinus sp.]